MANTLQAGFARVNINPPLGIHISGYFVERKAEGFLDDLEAVAGGFSICATFANVWKPKF